MEKLVFFSRGRICAASWLLSVEIWDFPEYSIFEQILPNIGNLLYSSLLVSKKKIVKSIGVELIVNKFFFHLESK